METNNLLPHVSEHPFYLLYRICPEIFCNISHQTIDINNLHLILDQKKSIITALFLGAITGHESLLRAVITTKFLDNFTIKLITKSPTHETIHHTLRHGQPDSQIREMIEYLKTTSTNVSICTEVGREISVLHWAAGAGLHGLLILALENDADVEKQDIDGYTALHISAWMNDELAVRALFEMGANVNTKAYNGRTPLDEARQQYCSQPPGIQRWHYDPPAVIWLMMENGVEEGYRDCDGTPLLHLAVMFKHLTLVRDLLDGDGRDNVNLVDKAGRTALHVAIKLGNKFAVAILVRKGADVTLKTFSGDTPFNLLYAAGGGGGRGILKILCGTKWKGCMRSRAGFKLKDCGSKAQTISFKRPKPTGPIRSVFIDIEEGDEPEVVVSPTRNPFAIAENRNNPSSTIVTSSAKDTGETHDMAISLVRNTFINAMKDSTEDSKMLMIPTRNVFVDAGEDNGRDSGIIVGPAWNTAIGVNKGDGGDSHTEFGSTAHARNMKSLIDSKKVFIENWRKISNNLVPTAGPFSNL